MSDNLNIHDIRTNMRVEGDDALLTKTQYIPPSFLDALADQRHESANAPMGDFHLAASIPVAVVEKWMAEGFNIYDKNIGLEAIMKRLQREDMERLIGTNKRLY